MPEGKHWLRNLQVNRVALVDAGANQKADVVLWKRQEPNPDLPDVHKPGGALAKLQADEPYWKRQFTSDQRQQMADAGTAMSDGGFPIANATDLKNAIQAYGRASNKAAAKAHIIKRAKALGLTDQLPDDWNVAKQDFAAITIKSEDGTSTTVTPAGAVYLGGGISTTGTSNVTFTGNTVEKAGRKISTRRLKELMASRDTLNAVIEEAQVEPATKREEDRMPEDEKVALTDEEREALPEEAQKYVKSLEDAVAKAAADKDETPAEDQVLKSLPEDVQKRFEAMEKRAADAEEIAKAEREKRENAEVAKRLETAKAAGIDPAEWAPKLRKIAETDSEFAAKVEETLNAAAERVRTGALFSELGKSTSEFGDSYGKLETLAKAKATADSIPEDEAMRQVMATDEGQRLYAEYTAQNEGRA